MLDNNSAYRNLGVSSEKEDVHNATQFIDKGIFPFAFCKIVEDIAGRENYCSIFHADGAGTKSSLAYMYYKELKDISIFKGIVRDAIVMNIDDILCVGATEKIYLSDTIGRNNDLITKEIIKVIIEEYRDYCDYLNSLGLDITFCGGETADVGDLVKTIILDASVFTSMKRKDVINAGNIQENDVIIGFASYGKASYEDVYNSGIGSNGLTLARHGTLSHDYYEKYPECFDQNLDESISFSGRYKLDDSFGHNLDIGRALLSPTRTYAPLIMKVLENFREDIHGIIHNTSGGHIKTLNFGRGIKYIKNNLFKTPKIFEIIQSSSETQWKEMFQVFNMGHRMEIYCDETTAQDIIKISKKYNVESKIIGFCQNSPSKHQNLLEIKSEFGSFDYEQNNIS